MGFRVQGSGFRNQDYGFMVEDFGFRVYGLRVRGQDSRFGFRVSSSDLRLSIRPQVFTEGLLSAGGPFPRKRGIRGRNTYGTNKIVKAKFRP